MATVFLRLLAHDDKPAALAQAVERLRDGEASPDVHVVDPESFRQVPGAPFAYWVSEKVRRLFTELTAFESKERQARRGASSGDDVGRIRAMWEVSPISIGKLRWWVLFSKGGAFSRFYSDVSLVVGWDNQRQTFEGFFGRAGRMIERPEALGFFFRPGLTWSRRSQRGLSLRVLPRDCIFSDKGPSGFGPESSRLQLLGLANSSAFHSLVLLQMAFGSYETGVIQRTPVPDLFRLDAQPLNKLVTECINIKRDLDRSNETSHVFHLPPLLQVPGEPLTARIAAWQTRIADTDRQLAENQREIDDISFRLYGIDGEDRRAMEEGSGLKTAPAEDVEAEDDEPGDDGGPAVEGKPLTAALLSYTMGCVVGRWDTRFATGERPTPELPDPFDPLPVCSPGMLQDDDGLPLRHTPEGYSLRIDWDGILVDDADHPDDIIRRVRDVLEVIFDKSLVHGPSSLEQTAAAKDQGPRTRDQGPARESSKKPARSSAWPTCGTTSASRGRAASGTIT